ncbi:MAG: metal ABC transporter permease, partial [Planctomycetes bacterium]|nr:metal ABC transporter permease [Planctomycetota bacterium]
WDLGLHAWLGASLALAIHAGGLMYAFGCLVLPALAARGACRTVRGQLVAAPVIAGVTALAMAMVADRWDLPPGQLTVAMLCGLVVVGRGIGALRR